MTTISVDKLGVPLDSFRRGIFSDINISPTAIENIEKFFSDKEGHMSNGQAAVIVWLLDKEKPKSIIEIGSLYGRSTCIAAASLEDVKISCIDTFTYSIEGVATSKSYREKFDNLTKEYSDRITVYEDYSFNVDSKFSDHSYDALFIDGDHSYEGLFKDISLYYRKLKPGGLIFGHDYPPLFNGLSDFMGLKNCVDGLVKNRVDLFESFGHVKGIWAAKYLGGYFQN